MSSFSAGGGQLDSSGWERLSNSRSFGTVYQNTTGNAVFVSVKVGNDIDGANMVGVGLYVGMAPNGKYPFAYSRVDTTDGSTGNFTNTMAYGIIPAGAYYEVRELGDTNAARLDYWTEQSLEIR